MDSSQDHQNKSPPAHPSLDEGKAKTNSHLMKLRQQGPLIRVCLGRNSGREEAGKPASQTRALAQLARKEKGLGNDDGRLNYSHIE